MCCNLTMSSLVSLRRVIPEDDHVAVQWVLEKIFTCQMSDLPPAMLVHRFWSGFSKIHSHGSNYLGCLKSKGINPSTALRGCREHIKSKCGQRFDPSNAQSETCKKHLWGLNQFRGAQYEPTCVKYRANGSDTNMPGEFKRYFSCLQKYDYLARQCAWNAFDVPCRACEIRAVKTVRAEMNQVGYLLQKYPNFHALHLFRDPRGAVASIHSQPWAQGMFGKHDIAREATLYCSQVLKDLSALDELKLKFPNRTRLLVYDDFVEHPMESLNATYSFLGEPLPPPVQKQLANRKRKGVLDPKAVAVSSMKRLSINQMKIIRDKCSKLYQVPLLRQRLGVQSERRSL